MSAEFSILLLDNASATGSAFKWKGGVGNFAVVGAFDGCTVTLQTLGPDGSTYLDVGTDVTFTAADQGNFELPEGTIRAEVTGGTSPSGLYARAVKI